MIQNQFTQLIVLEFREHLQTSNVATVTKNSNTKKLCNLMKRNTKKKGQL